MRFPSARIAFVCLATFVAVLFLGGWRATLAAAQPQAEEATQVRVRELIYVLRQYRVFERNEEWCSAIRELTQIGPPALSELLLELKQTERNATLRGVLFTLRAIDDPRALPFLMDALPKAVELSNRGSDCAFGLANPDLQQFMQRHQNHPRDDDNVSYGRPINEILSALHKLSRTQPPDLTKGLEPSWKADYWVEWWIVLEQSGRAPKKDDAIVMAPRTEDLVERDGVRKFGRLFPTGAGQYLSPIAQVTLESYLLANVPSSIDFDTGRIFEYHEGVRYDAKTWETDYSLWPISNGIDLSSANATDLHVWQIDNDRWDTLDAEVRSEKPFDIGRETSSLFVDENQIGTFLFTTREGARGVLRKHGVSTNDLFRFEYRLWNRSTNAVEVRRPFPSGVPGEWNAKRLAILKEPEFGNQCFFDLESGKSEVLPTSVTPGQSVADLNELFKTKFALFNDDTIVGWARSRGIDIATQRFRPTVMEGKGVDRPQQIAVLTVLDARISQMTAAAFDNLSLARAREILSRTNNSFGVAYLLSLPDVDTPSTYIVETKSGLIGLIAIVNVEANKTSISFKYKSANAPGGTKK